MYINEAKKISETLFYGNEKAIKFKVFNSKFQNLVNILYSYDFTMHNKDIVYLLWTKFNNTELTTFVASIKVDYHCNHQKFTKKLQTIATKIQTEKTPLFTTAGVSELNTGDNNNHNTAACTAKGSHFPYGTLYNRSYLYKQWVSSAVTPHHDDICASQ